jgi:hypothetical protein
MKFIANLAAQQNADEEGAQTNMQESVASDGMKD